MRMSTKTRQHAFAGGLQVGPAGVCAACGADQGGDGGGRAASRGSAAGHRSAGGGVARRPYRLPPPDDAEVARVTACIARRIVRLLEYRGLGPQSDPDEPDPLLRDQPLLAMLYGASVQG